MKLRRTLLLVLLGFLATGAGRARQGTDVRAAGGLSRYGFGDCGGWAYRVPDKPVGLKASHVFEAGAIAVAEAGWSSGNIDKVSYEGTKPEADRATPDYVLGDNFQTFSAALRGGWQFTYGGIEAGPVIYSGFGARCTFDPGESDPCRLRVAPSAEAWAGHPDWGYGWAKFLSGPPVSIYGNDRLGASAAGIGRRTEDYKVELGYGTSGVLLEGDAYVEDRLLLGASLHFLDTGNWAALGTVGWHFGE